MKGRVAAFAALAALALQLVVPSGFMPAATGSGPALVICTGHGPLLTHGQPGKAPDTKSGGVCAFAGHGAPPVQPSSVFLAPRPFEATPAATLARIDLAPGRGLAAPPPPSQGPPVSIL